MLDRLSKCELPAEVVQFVRDSTRNFGKAKLVLKHNRHYIEAADADKLRKLLKNKTVAAARIADDARAGDAAAASSDADGFQVNDALVEMDANLEYRLLADEVRARRARGGGAPRRTARWPDARARAPRAAEVDRDRGDSDDSDDSEDYDDGAKSRGSRELEGRARGRRWRAARSMASGSRVDAQDGLGMAQARRRALAPDGAARLSLDARARPYTLPARARRTARPGGEARVREGDGLPADGGVRL